MEAIVLNSRSIKVQCLCLYSSVEGPKVPKGDYRRHVDNLGLIGIEMPMHDIL